MDRYIGMDVHAASTTLAVIDARGKKLHSKIIETASRRTQTARTPPTRRRCAAGDGLAAIIDGALVSRRRLETHRARAETTPLLYIPEAPR
jgi:hypothetical protein